MLLKFKLCITDEKARNCFIDKMLNVEQEVSAVSCQDARNIAHENLWLELVVNRDPSMLLQDSRHPGEKYIDSWLNKELSQCEVIK